MVALAWLIIKAHVVDIVVHTFHMVFASLCVPSADQLLIVAMLRIHCAQHRATFDRCNVAYTLCPEHSPTLNIVESWE